MSQLSGRKWTQDVTLLLILAAVAMMTIVARLETEASANKPADGPNADTAGLPISPGCPYYWNCRYCRCTYKRMKYRISLLKKSIFLIFWTIPVKTLHFPSFYFKFLLLNFWFQMILNLLFSILDFEFLNLILEFGFLNFLILNF